MSKKHLAKELQKRGTAEIVNGETVQVTQAINETDNSAEFLVFGELRKVGVIPIEQACAKCDHQHFPNIKDCQEKQRQGAISRGFQKITCPNQFLM